MIILVVVMVCYALPLCCCGCGRRPAEYMKRIRRSAAFLNFRFAYDQRQIFGKQSADLPIVPNCLRPTTRSVIALSRFLALLSPH